MDIKLHATQSVRVLTSYTSANDNFVDIESLKDCTCLRITNWSLSQQYIEVRKKNNQIAMFLFKKKSDKKWTDLGYWEDAEVVYSINEVKIK